MPRQIILITGASSGIGHEIAKTLSDQCTVILVSRNKARLKTLQTEYRKAGKDAFLYAMDLSKESSIRSVTKKIRSAFPRIDWIINCAGSIEHGKSDTLRYKEIEFEKILQVNLIGPYRLIKELQSSLTRGSGGVFNISSTAGLRGNPRFPFYSASKAALINLTESLSRSDLFLQTSKKAISIIPGPTNTPMRQKIAKDANTKQSPTIIAHWIADAITKHKVPKSGSSIFFTNGSITRKNPK